MSKALSLILHLNKYCCNIEGPEGVKWELDCAYFLYWEMGFEALTRDWDVTCGKLQLE